MESFDNNQISRDYQEELKEATQFINSRDDNICSNHHGVIFGQRIDAEELIIPDNLQINLLQVVLHMNRRDVNQSTFVYLVFTKPVSKGWIRYLYANQLGIPPVSIQFHKAFFSQFNLEKYPEDFSDFQQLTKDAANEITRAMVIGGLCNRVYYYQPIIRMKRHYRYQYVSLAVKKNAKQTKQRKCLRPYCLNSLLFTLKQMCPTLITINLALKKEIGSAYEYEAKQVEAQTMEEVIEIFDSDEQGEDSSIEIVSQTFKRQRRQ